MTRIAILGRGNVARTLAGGWSASGHEIALGARNRPESEPTGFPELTLGEAIDGGEVVINALPGDASAELLRPYAAALQGRILIDVANAVRPAPDGHGLSLIHPNSSLAEELAKTLPGCRVVKTLNTVHVSAMAQPERLTDPVAFVSGDDAAARAESRALLADLGWRAEQVVELGGLATARGPEAFLLLVPWLAGAFCTDVLTMAIARERVSSPPEPANVRARPNKPVD